MLWIKNVNVYKKEADNANPLIKLVAGTRKTITKANKKIDSMIFKTMNRTGL